MAEKQELRIVSAVADKKQAVLYLEDGNTIILKQGDHRLGDLLDVVIPITTRGEIAVVNLTDFSVYAAFEQKSGGMTKFFKMAKNKVKGWFGGNTDTHKLHMPEEGKAALLKAVEGETITEEEVLEHGQPIDVTDEVGEDEVVVAVVTTPAVPATEKAPAQPEKKAVIPGVNSIKTHISHAVKTNSVGVQAFLARCAQFIDKRQHSVDDLMRFLERGDLPFADDGSIIAYKMLRRKAGTDDTFVDCHSGKIPQKVGSYVCVNENLVDLNRRNECSNGLHIARRGYLSGFGGDVCVLCKIDPEDVMVVPHNDPNKVRVKGYHILGVMSPEAMAILKQNKPMTGDEEALTMVYNAIKGNHVDRIEWVQVNGQMGSNVEITKLKHDKTKGREGYQHSGSDLAKAAAMDDEVNVVGAVDPRDINKRVNEEHQKLSGNADEVLLTDEGDEDIHGTEPEDDDDNEVEGSELDQSEEHLALTDEDKQAVSEMHDDIVDRLAAKPETPEPAKTSALDDLLLDYQTAPEGNAKVDAARALVAFKKAKKKGWDKLGVNQLTVDAILRDAQTEATPAPTPAPAKTASKPKAGTKEKKAKAPAPAKEPAKKKAAAIPPAPAAPTSSKTPTKAEEARALYDAGDMNALRDFKKRVKKGWEVLGFTSSEIEKILK